MSSNPDDNLLGQIFYWLNILDKVVEERFPITFQRDKS